MQEKTAIIIPTYNEKENIETLINKIKKIYPGILVVVVDDNSPDGTAGSVRMLAKKYKKITLIRRWKKIGLASAYQHAFYEILKDENILFIATMDADLSHDPMDLIKLLAASAENSVIVGSRYVKGGRIENWTIKRRLLSKYGNLYARIITGIPVNDMTAGFVVYFHEILRSILKTDIKSEGYAFQIEMKYRAHRAEGLVKEVPITFRERENGVSKLSKKIILEGIITPLQLRFRKHR